MRGDQRHAPRAIGEVCRGETDVGRGGDHRMLLQRLINAPPQDTMPFALLPSEFGSFALEAQMIIHTEEFPESPQDGRPLMLKRVVNIDEHSDDISVTWVRIWGHHDRVV